MSESETVLVESEPKTVLIESEPKTVFVESEPKTVFVQNQPELYYDELIPGQTYLLKNILRNRYLESNNGWLGYVRYADGESENALWICTKKGIYLGFQNVADGKFLGTEVLGRVIAKASSMKEWESFIVVHHADGYHLVKQSGGEFEYSWDIIKA